MTEKQNQMISLFNQIIPKETVITTAVTGLSLFRIDDSFSRTPYSYNSEIIILAQGEKVVYLGEDKYTYDSSHYLVLPVPLPAECEGRVSMGKPILGLSIDIDPIEVGEILLEMEDNIKGVKALPKGIYTSQMNDNIYDATIRLLKTIAEPEDRRVLAPMIKKEIIYRVLQGENGEILQSLVHRNRRFFQIARVIQKINDSYSDRFDIDKLAEDLEMSNSTFHSSFKEVTNTSPLQYVKNVRLHKARIFMIQDGLSANSAAFRVGYESPSQFSREYKRLFGSTPAGDANFQRSQQTEKSSF